MAGTAPGAPRLPGERRLIGLFSLVLGAILFALILTRAQQAGREGNRELRNATYWVLVSPLVFSGFGLYLLRSSGQPPAALQRSVQVARRESEQSEQVLGSLAADAERRLAEAGRELEAARATAEASEKRLREAAAESRSRIGELEAQLQAMRQTRDRAEADLQTLLETRSGSQDRSRQQALALGQRIDQLSRELQQRLADTRNQQTKALAAQRAELERLQQNLSQTESSAVGARDRATASMATLEQRLQGLEQERSQLQNAVEQLRREQSTASQNAVAGAEAARAELARLLGGLNEQQSALQTELDRLLQQESAQLAEARAQLQAALADLQAVRNSPGGNDPDTSSRLVEMAQQIQEAQQAGQRGSSQVAAALAGLERARSQLHTGLEATRQRLEQEAGRVSEQVGQARADAARALRLSQEAQARLESFQKSARSRSAATAGGAARSGFQAGYHEACEEIGVPPGSDWAVVRSAWRRNIKQWHPDQGGDPTRWTRRQTAYQLLTAWYEFNDPARS